MLDTPLKLLLLMQGGKELEAIWNYYKFYICLFPVLGCSWFYILRKEFLIDEVHTVDQDKRDSATVLQILSNSRKDSDRVLYDPRLIRGQEVFISSIYPLWTWSNDCQCFNITLYAMICKHFIADTSAGFTIK